MEDYTKLMTLTGAKTFEQFSRKLKDAGIVVHDSQVYGMAKDCEDNPEHIKNYGRDFRDIIPKNIEAMKEWSQRIQNHFTEVTTENFVVRTPPATTSFQDRAEEMLMGLLLEAGQDIILSPEALKVDPMAFYGMCTCLELDPNKVTVAQAIQRLTSTY